CKMFVDARGISSLIQKDRTGILQSAQYEIYADWIKKDRVNVYLDAEKFPGFFAWVIPSSYGRGKVGLAGRGINAAYTLNQFLGTMSDHCIIRKIYAPIWIKGPIEKFVDGRVVTIGDAAGQAKPTTAGGIFSSGMGGIFAGRAISKFLSSGNRSDLEQYQKNWKGMFGREFTRQLLARKILERLDNITINKLCKSITPDMAKEISEKDDFDFHTSSVVRLLGASGTIQAIRAIAGAELQKILR
ncbi:MAG: dehydrogenase, partial [Thaumarchaeota archaeon]|nr:dehydrogenase [Nitrososphaerota archaeon]